MPDFDALTERERECLRGILAHKTAKEMGRDLGISHHAVEKRLLRARTKLGATTSLEAARSYASHYGLTAYGRPDLPQAKMSSHHGNSAAGLTERVSRFGGSFMIFTTILGAAALNAATMNPGQVDAGFARLDIDNSGFIEKAELTGLLGKQSVTVIRSTRMDDTTEAQTLKGDEAVSQLDRVFEMLDADEDGKLSKAELAPSLSGETGKIVTFKTTRQ